MLWLIVTMMKRDRHLGSTHVFTPTMLLDALKAMNKPDEDQTS